MKRILFVLLAVMMVVSLWGCTGNEDVRGQVSGNTKPAGEETVQQTEPAVSMGKTESNVYKNDFLGISCALSSDWVFYTDEQIRELNNFAADAAGEEFEEAVAKANIIYDMQANNQVDYSNINVNMEKLSPLQAAALDIKKTLESQFSLIESSLSNMGFENIEVAYAQITVDGKVFDGIKVKAQIQGIDFFEEIISFKKGSYFANVTVAYYRADAAQSIWDCFTVS